MHLNLFGIIQLNKCALLINFYTWNQFRYSCHSNVFDLGLEFRNFNKFTRDFKCYFYFIIFCWGVVLFYISIKTIQSQQKITSTFNLQIKQFSLLVSCYCLKLMRFLFFSEYFSRMLIVLLSSFVVQLFWKKKKTKPYANLDWRIDGMKLF